MLNKYSKDWGEISIYFDKIKDYRNNKDLSQENEAQTRFDIIDRLLREVLGWQHGQITVEEATEKRKYVDYILKCDDNIIVIEAKRVGTTFPTPTKKKQLKLYGSVLGIGETKEAIAQALDYGISKNAKLIVVTNGDCWCIFKTHDSLKEKDIFGHLYFPFDVPSDAEQLFNILNNERVADGSLSSITNYTLPVFERRLLSLVKDSEARIERNNIADFISPALNNALHADAIINDINSLSNCFVFTEARAKYDKLLDMHLVDYRPVLIRPAKRIKTYKKPGEIGEVIERSTLNATSPITLIIAPVGSGKSTFLKYFEKISGKAIIQKNHVHWIYVDFELMGKTGNPRSFIYSNLLNYLNDTEKAEKTDYKTVIEPAYQKEIESLTKGLYHLVARDKEKLRDLIIDHIKNDYEKVEPYVDKIFTYIAQKNLCVIVLDNIDLYEDEKLETIVFSEGLALAKKVRCSVIISLRDTTFIKHKNDSIFDAFEMRKFWLDPPPFRAVLSRRLAFSKQILKNKEVELYSQEGKIVEVKDLSIFFDIVQRSLLQGQAGDFIEALSDANTRKGLTLVLNFLTSGHINTERSIITYLAKEPYYSLPFHEIFKGAILSHWRYYKEDRSDCLNIFDSRRGAGHVRLLRFFILSYLFIQAHSQTTVEVSVKDCIELFTRIGANESQICNVIADLCKASLVRSASIDSITRESTIFLTKSGGYCFKILSAKFEYIEACMYDTAIDNEKDWEEISNLTITIEQERNGLLRMQYRQQRVKSFLNYLCALEKESLQFLTGYENLGYMDFINDSVTKQVSIILEKIQRRIRNQ